ncbi:hypothetical protein Dimus_003112 [Dionaea muscipula]
MADIQSSSRSQNLNLQLQTLGPFFRITARSSETNSELGRAEGLIRVEEGNPWDGEIHFWIGLFIGAVAIRHGFDCGCATAQLLAINDSDLYHSKVSSLLPIYSIAHVNFHLLVLVRFYTRIGFKAVHEVTGGSLVDIAHMLVWGGRGTRMDASIEKLLVKWCSRFKSPSLADCSLVAGKTVDMVAKYGI